MSTLLLSAFLTVEEDGDAEALEKTADKSSSSAWADSKDTWPLMCVPKDIVKKHPLSHPASKHVTLSCSPTPSFHLNRDGWWTMRRACMGIWTKEAQEWEGNTVFSKLHSSYVQWGGHCLVNQGWPIPPGYNEAIRVTEQIIPLISNQYLLPQAVVQGLAESLVDDVNGKIAMSTSLPQWISKGGSLCI